VAWEKDDDGDYVWPAESRLAVGIALKTFMGAWLGAESDYRSFYGLTGTKKSAQVCIRPCFYVVRS